MREKAKKRKELEGRGKEEIVKSESFTFLHARTIFFKSYSEESPCTVVKVLRPFRCWILICTRPSWTSSSEPLIASAKGSAKQNVFVNFTPRGRRWKDDFNEALFWSTINWIDILSNNYWKRNERVLIIAFCDASEDAVAILSKLSMCNAHRNHRDQKFDNYRMCWDSGWTYDKQNISLGDIRLQIANKLLEN